MRYEDDGTLIVLQGPIATSGKPESEKVFTVASNEVVLALNTPVICHGLKKSTHLNGKIGDL